MKQEYLLEKANAIGFLINPLGSVSTLLHKIELMSFAF